MKTSREPYHALATVFVPEIVAGLKREIGLMRQILLLKKHRSALVYV